mmetsp:Transcript_20392/g.78360  ORF Transcript_20392/g.78360 Transcript_20392/m.78360 type:complete len:218 (-) Transcript_20392:238-891(-)
MAASASPLAIAGSAVLRCTREARSGAPLSLTANEPQPWRPACAAAFGPDSGTGEAPRASRTARPAGLHASGPWNDDSASCEPAAGFAPNGTNPRAEFAQRSSSRAHAPTTRTSTGDGPWRLVALAPLTMMDPAASTPEQASLSSCGQAASTALTRSTAPRVVSDSAAAALRRAARCGAVCTTSPTRGRASSDVGAGPADPTPSEPSGASRGTPSVSA